MKRLLSMLLACLLLTACGQAALPGPDRREDSSASQSLDDRREGSDHSEGSRSEEDADRSEGSRSEEDTDRSEGPRSEEDADRSQAPLEEGPLPAINFIHHYDSVEYADIMAFDQNGIVVWEYTTPKLEAAQLDQVEAIGLVGDSYLFTCSGKVVCLNARTGEERWTNPDFEGAQSHFAIRGDTVFLCGFFGPDLFALSASTGETIHRIDSLDQDYYWPFELELDGDRITVSMSGGPEGDLGPDNCHYIHVDLNDWTVVPG